MWHAALIICLITLCPAGSVHQYNASTYTDVLLQYSNVLAHYPSVCQVGINVAESHALCIDVERMVAENTVPYILLRQRNKCKLDLRCGQGWALGLGSCNACWPS